MDAKDYREIQDYWFGGGYLQEAQSRRIPVEILSGRIELAMEHIKLLGEILISALTKLHTMKAELARWKGGEYVTEDRLKLAAELQRQLNEVWAKEKRLKKTMDEYQ